MDFKTQLSQFAIKDHGDYQYLFDELTANFEHRFFNDHLFIFKKEDLWMTFAFFQHVGCGFDNEDKEVHYGDLFWYGDGPLGSLKELRHSYFPEYVFYASPSFIKQCCDIILEYFEE